MRETTRQNMINAFGGESMAHMRYLRFAAQAVKEGFPNIARLWTAISHAEYIHAFDHYNELKELEGGFLALSMGTFGPGDTRKNLRLSIMGEAFEIEEMYPTYIETAKFQNEKSAQRSFEWSYGTEKMHLALYEKAISYADRGKDADLGPIQVCEVCGYTVEGEAPDICPICGAKREKFSAFS